MLWCTFIPEFWHYPVRKNIRLFKYLVCMGRMRMCSLITHYAVFLPYSNCLLQCETAIWDKSIPHHLNITISTSNDVVIYINTSNIEMCGNMNENINLKLYIQKKKKKRRKFNVYLSVNLCWMKKLFCSMQGWSKYTAFCWDFLIPHGWYSWGIFTFLFWYARYAAHVGSRESLSDWAFCH